MNKDIQFSIPIIVQTRAARGLELHNQYGRGGTNVGLSTARRLAKGESVDYKFIRKVSQYFPRHEGDKLEEKDPPSNGWIAWLLWGGWEGWRWSKRIVEQMEK